MVRESLAQRAPALLRLAGEVPPHANIRVKRVRAHEVSIVHVDLVLRSTEGDFHRTVCLAHAPRAVRAALEQGRTRAPLARDATPGDLPKAVRLRLDEVVEEQTALGYEVEVARITVTREQVVSLRYRRDRRPWLDVWLSTGTPAVVAYEKGRGLLGLGGGWSSTNSRPLHVRSKPEQVAFAIGTILWFLYLTRGFLAELF